MSPPDENKVRFEGLYAEHHDPILGYLLRRTSDPQDAADLLGETFLVAWRRLGDVPGGAESRLWLYGVARNLLANHRRRERSRTGLTDRLRAELAATYRPVEPESGGVGAVFRSLSDADRELLSLVAWEGLDHAEIATVLGCSRNAVRIRLHRARRRFSQALERAVPRSLTSVPEPNGRYVA